VPVLRVLFFPAEGDTFQVEAVAKETAAVAFAFCACVTQLIPSSYSP
jgi:hypothetical protein